ncbi:hypothetical protein AgCh_032018 [Apium graveolens]
METFLPPNNDSRPLGYVFWRWLSSIARHQRCLKIRLRRQLIADSHSQKIHTTLLKRSISKQARIRRNILILNRKVHTDQGLHYFSAMQIIQMCSQHTSQLLVSHHGNELAPSYATLSLLNHVQNSGGFYLPMDFYNLLPEKSGLNLLSQYTSASQASSAGSYTGSNRTEDQANKGAITHKHNQAYHECTTIIRWSRTKQYPYQLGCRPDSWSDQIRGRIRPICALDPVRRAELCALLGTMTMADPDFPVSSNRLELSVQGSSSSLKLDLHLVPPSGLMTCWLLDRPVPLNDYKDDDGSTTSMEALK